LLIRSFLLILIFHLSLSSLLVHFMSSDSDSSDAERRNRLLECVTLATNPMSAASKTSQFPSSAAANHSTSASSFANPLSFTVDTNRFTVYPLQYRPPPERPVSHYQTVSSGPPPSCRESSAASGPHIPIGLIERLLRQLDALISFEDDVWSPLPSGLTNAEEKKEKIRLFRKRKKSAEEKEKKKKEKREKKDKEHDEAHAESSQAAGIVMAN
jgi:hypothetical protein